MASDEARAMEALMGFSSFGGPRKHRRGPLQALKKGSEPRELTHVMPGTAPDTAQFPSDRVRSGPHGVVFLIKSTDQAPINLGDHLPCVSEAQTTQATPQNHDTASPSSPLPVMELLEELHNVKTRFDDVESSLFVRTRGRVNPYEPLGRHHFINRAAMKLANLDFVFGWTGEAQKPLVFADLCGGPGGFSEYLLWRMQQTRQPHSDRSEVSAFAVGFGISLRGTETCDWDLPQSVLYGNEFHICYGADGTGDLYSIENIHSFRDDVHARYPEGVDLVVADGGFTDARNQHDQELMMARLVLAEVTAMLSVIRTGGSFVCKTFELTAPPMLQLLWILHQCFEEITIVKPIASRPASSERYLTARNFQLKARTDVLRNLEQWLVAFAEGSKLEPSGDWRQDRIFLNFVSEITNLLARSQIQACTNILEAITKSAKRKRDITPVDPQAYYHCWKLGE